MYAQAQGEDAAAGNAAGNSGAAQADDADDVVDAEFEDVDDKKITLSSQTDAGPHKCAGVGLPS